MSELYKTDIHKTIEAVWKIESTRLIAGIARVTRDIGLAEELGGFGHLAVSLLQRYPELRATLMDVPEVIRIVWRGWLRNLEHYSDARQ